MIIEVHVTTKASSNQVVKDLAAGVYRVRTTAAPERGEANKKVLELLADELGVPKSKLTIVNGLTWKKKLVRIEKE